MELNDEWIASCESFFVFFPFLPFFCSRAPLSRTMQHGVGKKDKQNMLALKEVFFSLIWQFELSFWAVSSFPFLAFYSLLRLGRHKDEMDNIKGTSTYTSPFLEVTWPVMRRQMLPIIDL